MEVDLLSNIFRDSVDVLSRGAPKSTQTQVDAPVLQLV
jgi:hypothetical protein